MKYFIIIILSGLLSSSLIAQKQDKLSTVKFEVQGVCDDCKGRIERAARYEKGVKVAEWDKKSGIITVTFRTGKTDQARLEKAIASAGYDTENVTADEASYAKLPHCCSYRRDDLEKH